MRNPATDGQARLIRVSAQGQVNPVPTGASMAFAEGFRPVSETSQAARREAVALGVVPISPGSASMLTVLARMIDARAVVEIGTGAGISGLALFEGMSSAGILTSVDTEHEVQAAARRAFTAATIPSRRFRLIAGEALDVLPKLSDGAYDLVFVNGDQLEFGEYVAQALRLLRHGGVVIINHALWANRIADPDNQEDETIVLREALSAVQDIEELTATLSPIGDGLVIAIKG